MADPEQAVDEPWYRNGWVWLVIAIPAATVLGGLFTLYLAITHPDPIVHDPAPTVSQQAKP